MKFWIEIKVKLKRKQWKTKIGGNYAQPIWLQLNPIARTESETRPRLGALDQSSNLSLTNFGSCFSKIQKKKGQNLVTQLVNKLLKMGLSWSYKHSIKQWTMNQTTVYWFTGWPGGQPKAKCNTPWPLNASQPKRWLHPILFVSDCLGKLGELNSES